MIQIKAAIKRLEELDKKAEEVCKELGGEYEGGTVFLICNVNIPNGRLKIEFEPIPIENTFNVKYRLFTKDGKVLINSYTEHAKDFDLFESDIIGYNIKILAATGSNNNINELWIYYRRDDKSIGKIELSSYSDLGRGGTYVSLRF